MPKEAVIEDDGFVYFYDPGDREKNKTWVSREKVTDVVDLRKFNRTLACFVQGWKAKMWLGETTKFVEFLERTAKPQMVVKPFSESSGETGEMRKRVAQELEQRERQAEINKATARGSFRVLVDNVVSNKCVSLTEGAGESLKNAFGEWINTNNFESAKAVIKQVDDIVFEKGQRYF